MNPKGLGLILIAVAFIVPMASANQPADDFGIGDITVTGEGQIIPNYGYYVYGEVKNFDLHNIREAIVEVTTYDQSGVLLDTLTTMVRPTIIEAGTKAPYLVVSHVPNQVYGVKVRLVSYKETVLSNFPYIEITNVSEVTEGTVTGTITNTHPEVDLYEVEIIATFYNYNGKVDEIKTYGVNNYGVLAAGESQEFTIASGKYTGYTVGFQTQSSTAYREPVLTMNITDNTPVVRLDMTIDFDVYPKQPGASALAIFYPPSGGEYPVGFTFYFDGTYQITMQPIELGTYKVRFVFPPTLVNQSRVYIEGTYIEETFTTEDAPIYQKPNLTDSTTTEPKNETESGTDTITDTITDTVKQQIPAYPVTSIILSIAAISLVLRRRASIKI